MSQLGTCLLSKEPLLASTFFPPLFVCLLVCFTLTQLYTGCPPVYTSLWIYALNLQLGYVRQWSFLTLRVPHGAHSVLLMAGLCWVFADAVAASLSALVTKHSKLAVVHGIDIPFSSSHSTCSCCSSPLCLQFCCLCGTKLGVLGIYVLCLPWGHNSFQDFVLTFCLLGPSCCFAVYTCSLYWGSWLLSSFCGPCTPHSEEGCVTDVLPTLFLCMWVLSAWATDLRLATRAFFALNHALDPNSAISLGVWGN